MPGQAGKVLTRMVAAFASGDASNAAEFVSDRYVDHQTGLRGVAGFADVVRAARAEYRTLDAQPLTVLDSRGFACARVIWRGTRADGTRINRETLDMVRAVGGRALEHWGSELPSESTPTAANER
jgi:hypothetical protein